MAVSTEPTSVYTLVFDREPSPPYFSVSVYASFTRLLAEIDSYLLDYHATRFWRPTGLYKMVTEDSSVDQPRGLGDSPGGGVDLDGCELPQVYIGGRYHCLRLQNVSRICLPSTDFACLTLQPRCRMGFLLPPLLDYLHE